MHRDKPPISEFTGEELDVFPICIGINRTVIYILRIIKSVPYMHRDKQVIYLI